MEKTQQSLPLNKTLTSKDCPLYSKALLLGREWEDSEVIQQQTSCGLFHPAGSNMWTKAIHTLISEKHRRYLKMLTCSAKVKCHELDGRWLKYLPRKKKYDPLSIPGRWPEKAVTQCWLWPKNVLTRNIQFILRRSLQNELWIKLQIKFKPVKYHFKKTGWQITILHPMQEYVAIGWHGSKCADVENIQDT